MTSGEPDRPGVPVQVHALDGVTVLDISIFLAGPYCAALLADFGADVLKVELPGVGDPLRRLGLLHEGSSLYWRTLSRNKRAITLDLRKPRGRELFLELVKSADIVVENFTPGTLERWGLGFDELRKMQPGLVLVRISGFGQNGPYRTRPAVARVGMAFGGLLDLVGEADGPPLMPGSAGLADYLAGVYAAYGAMLALRHRERTGEGQEIDLALFEPIFHMLEDNVELFDKLGFKKKRLGAANPNAAPHNNVRSRDGRWLAIACSSDELYRRLCDAMERPDLRDHPEFRTNQLRIDNRIAIEKIVNDWAIELDAADLLDVLHRFDIPAALVYDVEDMFRDEQYQAREAIIRVQTDDIGDLAMPGIIPKLSRTPGQVKHAGGPLGRDNDTIFREMLGLDESEIEKLRMDGVI